jgi:hypothetical protein
LLNAIQPDTAYILVIISEEELGANPVDISTMSVKDIQLDVQKPIEYISSRIYFCLLSSDTGTTSVFFTSVMISKLNPDGSGTSEPWQIRYDGVNSVKTMVGNERTFLDDNLDPAEPSKLYDVTLTGTTRADYPNLTLILENPAPFYVMDQRQA